MEKQNEEEVMTKDNVLNSLLSITNKLLKEVEDMRECILSPSGNMSDISFIPKKGYKFSNIQSKEDRISLSLEKKSPKRADDLSGLMVGDKVWSYTAGWGIVTDIDVDMETVYPINVKYLDESTSCFTRNGFEIASDINQTLFLTEIKFEIPTID